MKNLFNNLLLVSCFLIFSNSVNSQDSISAFHKLSPAYISQSGKKAEEIKNKLDRKSQQLIARLRKQENKLYRRLMKIDSMAAQDLFRGTDDRYQQLTNVIEAGPRDQYIPRLDTLVTSLQLLNNSPALFNKTKETEQHLANALQQVKGLKDKLQQADAIKKFIKERKKILQDQLSKFGFAKQLKRINKEVYYYSQQVNEYKAIIKEPGRAEKKAIELLSRTRVFKEFMQRNSQLAFLFPAPGQPGEPVSLASLAGLQTRVQVNSMIQQQVAMGGPNAQQQFQQNLQAAQSQLNQLKDKVMKMGGSSSDMELPDFKPNTQRTKSFLERLEYGTNIQTQKASNFFPTTTDIGLSIGYKLNDKSVIGIGSSFKMGLGTGFRNIRISSQGVGLRSYLDYKIKGSFWVSGGFEMNYRDEIRSIAQLKEYPAWQQSGLIGISKSVSVRTKFFKKTKLQLLWDFLSYQQVPQAQPLVFRIGYNF